MKNMENERIKSIKAKIAFAKKQLAKIKPKTEQFKRGEITIQEYEPYLAQKKAWTAQIHELEQRI